MGIPGRGVGTWPQSKVRLGLGKQKGAGSALWRDGAAAAFRRLTDGRCMRRLWLHLKPLVSLSDKKRPWGFLVMAALAVGIPTMVGAAVGQFSAGALGSMGGLVILYMPSTAIPHRMVTLAVCSFGFAASFAFGVLTSFNPYLSAATLGMTAFIVTVITRFFALPPPGSFFFILVACLSRTLPFDLALAPERVGIVLLGCMGACLLALGYSVFVKPQAETAARPPDWHIAAIVLESGLIAVFVGGSYLFALLIGLDNPYWVPVSCAAIMQGATFRAVWHRKVHRIVGTAIGMGVAWAIFSLPLGPWELALVVTLLSFLIEILVTRNYGLAVIFITPLTVIFAEAALASANPSHLMLVRLFDIVIGSSFGYLGGWVVHHPQLFRALEARLKEWRGV